MKLVCDAGPLIALAQVRELDIVASLFEKVLVPLAVESEILAKSGPESEVLRKALDSWILVVELPEGPSKASSQLADIDRGERAAILLAHQTGSTLLIDDRAGRAAARSIDVPITGVAGLLIMAKKKGQVDAVVPLLQEMRRHGYWLSDELLRLVGRLADESLASKSR